MTPSLAESAAVRTEELQSLALAFLGDARRRQDWRAFYDLALCVPPIHMGRGHWLISGHEDVVAAMKDEGAALTALYPVTRSPTLNELFLGLLPYENGANHRRLRSVTQSLFSAEVMSRLEPQVSALLSELLFPAVFEAEGCDVLGTLGVQVPQRMSCLLLDVAPEDWAAIGQWSRKLYKQIGRYDQTDEELLDAEKSYQELSEYVQRRAHNGRWAKQAGIGEALVAGHRNGQLDDQQLLAYFALFLFTGLDTLTHAIGNSIWFLGNEFEIFSKLRAEPSLTDVAFLEAMRLWGPIRLCVRHLQQPIALSSEVLPTGATILLLIHAANRDPRYLKQPNDLHWNRSRGEHLAFGVGAHGCLGMAVGRMVGKTLYRLLVNRCTALRANPGKDNPQFIPSVPILGIDSVRLFAEAK